MTQASRRSEEAVRSYRDPLLRTLLVEYLLVASLLLNPKNPRLHSDRQIQQIAGSITAFGFNVPILVC